MNKAKQVREALDLTPKEAGNALFGYTGKQSYDLWMQWEAGRRTPSIPTDQFFNVILILAKAKDSKTKNSSGALDLVLKKLRKTI